MVLIPIIAPIDKQSAIQPWLTDFSAKATGLATSNLLYEIIPVNTIETPIYNRTAIIKVPIIPIGIYFSGFLTSAADADITSKPKKAKKTVVAPLNIPEKWKGKYGV